MGYYNPIYRYGVDAFARDAVASGVDGAIVVDLPPEEDDELAVPARREGLAIVRLARERLPGCPVHLSASPAPTSPPPLAGEHTAEVLAEVLGLRADEVEKLRAQGVLG